jgi:hypothetical protein
MAGKKAHKPREPKRGAVDVGKFSQGSRKSAAQTGGQYEQDRKRRIGQYTGAGEAGITKR